MMLQKKIIAISAIVGVLLLGSIAAMVYAKGYPWTCGQATAAANQSQAAAVKASKDYADNLLDKGLNQKFKDELARSESAFAAKQKLCR